jgi:hypothetical protein
MPNRTRNPEYKPLLLTTTMRNPERLRNNLIVLKQFDGKVLTNKICTDICGELIREGLYRPTREVSDTIKGKWADQELLSNTEVLHLLDANPQDHKEAGFDKGWPSRFDTIFKLGLWFGFVHYEMGEKVEFSKLGELYIEQSEFDGQKLFANDEQQVFLNAFARYHRQNPYQRVLNHNKPLILLLQVLDELAKNKEFGSAGLYVHELPFLLIWKDNDYLKFTKTILDFRKTYGFNPSTEIVFERAGVIHGGWKPRKDKIESITKEYPDELLRKFRLTGLFSLRGNGRVISINEDMREVVKYLIANYATLQTFSTTKKYFNFASQVDDFLIKSGKPKLVGITDEDQAFLVKWIDHFGIDKIKAELLKVGKGRTTDDAILRLSPSPVRLEFLSSLLLKEKFASAKVVANYSRDDEGLPISHAPGNNPDIELHMNPYLELYEVTLTTGTNQAKAEFAPITRHLKDKVEAKHYLQEHIKTVLVAPSIHIDFQMWADFIKHSENLNIEGLTIEQFAK